MLTIRGTLWAPGYTRSPALSSGHCGSCPGHCAGNELKLQGPTPTQTELQLSVYHAVFVPVHKSFRFTADYAACLKLMLHGLQIGAK